MYLRYKTLKHIFKEIYSGLKSLTAARACSSTYLDKLPSPAVEKVLSYLTVVDLLSTYNVSSVFADEAPRALKLLVKKTRIEQIFSLVDMNDIANLKCLKEIDQGYLLVVDEMTGDTLLHRAVERKLHNVCDILLKVDGVQINAINNIKLTPLHLAIKSGDVSLVKKLIAIPAIDANVYFPLKIIKVLGLHINLKITFPRQVFCILQLSREIARS